MVSIYLEIVLVWWLMEKDLPIPKRFRKSYSGLKTTTTKPISISQLWVSATVLWHWSKVRWWTTNTLMISELSNQEMAFRSTWLTTPSILMFLTNSTRTFWRISLTKSSFSPTSKSASQWKTLYYMKRNSVIFLYLLAPSTIQHRARQIPNLWLQLKVLYTHGSVSLNALIEFSSAWNKMTGIW